MEPIRFDDIQFTISAADVAPRLHIDEGTDDFRALEGLIAEARGASRPKAICTISYISDRGDDFVVMDGVRMGSHVVAVNTANVHRVFPYVATCGTEAEAWSASIRDPLMGWWADAIKLQLLGKAFQYMEDRLGTELKLGHLAKMNPGSLPDWPITEQPKLFSLLGDVRAAIGVTLTESMLMLPTKSVSGFFFQTETSYENCQLCERRDCPGRRKPFDEAQYDSVMGKR
jgi:hypothetical protein